MNDPKEEDRTKFELCEPFNIDDGELDGLSNVQCFVLGAEFMVRREDLIKGLPSFEFTVHQANSERIASLAVGYNYDVSIEKIEGCAEWSFVKGKKRE